MPNIEKRYTIKEISDLDRNCRELVKMFSVAKIKIGLELAKNLKAFEDNELYKKLDPDSYPSFKHYLDSLDIHYKTAREIIGIYECFVLAANISIDELAKVAYHRLTIIKPQLFDKENGEYKLVKPKSELNKWIADAKSDMSYEDLSQKRKELQAGEHKHQFIKMQICQICKLKEYIN